MSNAAKTSKTKLVALRVPLDVLARLQRRATENGRTLSAHFLHELNPPEPAADHKQVQALSLTDIIEREITPRFKQSHKAAHKALGE